MDKNKIVSMVIILAVIVVIAGGLSRAAFRDSFTLAEYAQQNQASGSNAGEQNSSASGSGNQPSGNHSSSSRQPSPSPDAPSPAPTASPGDAKLTGAALNGTSELKQRVQLAEGFYYEPISEKLRRYMTGISFPAAQKGEELSPPEITFDELRYVHVMHYDFDGSPAEGELICNEYIAQDLLEIFHELYRNEYRLEKILLIDEYEGSHTASMEDNNTFCFHYFMPEESSGMSKHAYGLAVDVNPFYNPLVSYGEDGQEIISPSESLPYANRSSGFPYKIDENDLCYKLFLRHGFTWGGNRNDAKAYQHFQKTKP